MPVRGSRMPRPDSLPEDLKDLAYRNCVELTHPRWNSDVQLLIKALRPFVEPPTPPVEPPKPSPVQADLRREAQPVPTPLPVQPAPRPSPDGTYGDVEVKKRSRLIPSLIAGGLALLGAIAAYFYLSQKNPTVPDVRGGTLAKATTKLESAHLAVGRTRTQIDPSKEANTVIAQTPPPNVKVSADTKVDLVLSPPQEQVDTAKNASQDPVKTGSLSTSGQASSIGPKKENTLGDGPEGVMILDATPPNGSHLKQGEPTQFTVTVRYRLTSLDKATLSIGLVEFDATGCSGNGHIPAEGHTPAFRGENTVTIPIQWTVGVSKTVSTKGSIGYTASF